MDGKSYLDKLIADALGAGRGQPEGGRATSFNLAEIRGVAIGLVAAGALGQADMDQTMADLEATLQEIGWLHKVSYAMTPMPAEILVARPPEFREAWRRAVHDPPSPSLRAVVPLVGHSIRTGGRTAALISLEVWSTHIALRMAHHELAAVPLIELSAHLHRPGWRAYDDAGAQYQRKGGGAGDTFGLIVETSVFLPGPSEQASTWTVVSDDNDERSITLH